MNKYILGLFFCINIFGAPVEIDNQRDITRLLKKLEGLEDSFEYHLPDFENDEMQLASVRESVVNLQAEIHALNQRKVREGSTLADYLRVHEYEAIPRAHSDAVAEIGFELRPTKFFANLLAIAQKYKCKQFSSISSKDLTYTDVRVMTDLMCDPEKIILPHSVRMLIRDMRTLFESDIALDTYSRWRINNLNGVQLTETQAETVADIQKRSKVLLEQIVAKFSTAE